MLDFQFDMVLCLDISCAWSVGNAKKIFRNFSSRFKEAAKVKSKNIQQLRIKIILFSSGDVCFPVKETNFFELPNEQNELNSFIEFLNPVTVNGFSNPSLDFISIAIDSNWDFNCDKSRQTIFILSNRSKKNKTSPKDLSFKKPQLSFSQLSDKWDGQSGMPMTSKRLILFAPDETPWVDIGTFWNNTIYYPIIEEQKDFKEEVILSQILNSI